MVTITNSLLAQLGTNRDNLQKFPFLRVKRAPGPGCCGAPSKPLDYNNAKLKIASLTGDRLVAFKAAVGADKLKIVYKNGQQVVEKIL